MTTWTASSSFSIPKVSGKLEEEIAYALRSLSREEWLAVLKRSASEAGAATLRTKMEAVQSGVRVLGRVAGYLGPGGGSALRGDLVKLERWIKDLPGRVRNSLAVFLSLPVGRQAEETSTLVLMILLFFAVTGGADLEGGLPDADRWLGIGNHRNIISHSVLLGLGAEFCLRLAANLITSFQDRLPDDHLPVWDWIAGYIRRNNNLAITVVWAGIGAHLLKDSALLGGGFKPYVGLPGQHSAAVHQSLFTINAGAAGGFAWHEFNESKTEKKGSNTDGRIH